MSRPRSHVMRKDWKVCLPAELAGTVEFLLLDPLHGKPQYGARAKLIATLLADWVSKQQGKPFVLSPDFTYVEPDNAGNP